MHTEGEENIREQIAEEYTDPEKMDFAQAREEQLKKDKKELDFETKQAIAELKRSVERNAKQDSTHDLALVQEKQPTEQSQEKKNLSWVNALFLSPSKKLMRETWGLVKRSKKLFGMSAILGATMLGTKTHATALESDRVIDSTVANTELPYGFDKKKLEQAGIVRIDAVQATDTTKEFFLISLASYHSFEDVKDAMKQVGLEPSSYETMEDVVIKNPLMAQKSRAIMSLKEYTNKLGNISYGTVTYDSKLHGYHANAFEINAAFDSDTDTYRFIAQRPKKSAQYEDGLGTK